MITAWLCWIYGKFMKWLVIYPMWVTWHKIRRMELKIYWQTHRIRKHWDDYMFRKEADGL